MNTAKPVATPLLDRSSVDHPSLDERPARDEDLQGRAYEVLLSLQERLPGREILKQTPQEGVMK